MLSIAPFPSVFFQSRTQLLITRRQQHQSRQYQYSSLEPSSDTQLIVVVDHLRMAAVTRAAARQFLPHRYYRLGFIQAVTAFCLATAKQNISHQVGRAARKFPAPLRERYYA